VRHEAIPYDNDGTLQLREKVFQKGFYRFCIDIGIRVEAKEKMKTISGRSNAEGRYGGYLLMRTGLLI